MTRHLPRLVLASTSPFRHQLLSRLGLCFETAAPGTDETSLDNEHPAATAERLAETKARAVAADYPEALIIGSDQVAYCGAAVYGKPVNVGAAMAQLQAMRGKAVIFHTGLCLLNARTGVAHLRGVATEVRFRQFTDSEIQRYLDREPDAIHCAGSAKCEALGITLLESMRGDDPNALIGLPLIALCDMLRAEGVDLP
jgi:septum formation protein